MSDSELDKLPNWQHRVDDTPSPEVEDEARHHCLGDHLSKTAMTP